MILGTPRIWWIAAALPLVLAIVLFATGAGGTLGTFGAVVLLFLAMGLFAAAPMRYGREKPAPPASAESVPVPETVTANLPPQPRPSIEARDASDV
jgi:hypothetical protein